MTRLAISTIRRDNLHRIVLEKFDGNRAALSRAAGVHPNQVNLLLSDNDTHRRLMGEGLARKFERGLDLPEGTLDKERPTSVLDETVSITPGEAPDGASDILSPSTSMESVKYYRPWLAQLLRHVTHEDNLHVFQVTSGDMSPEVDPGDHVVVDTGVKAVSSDGIYILQRGGTCYFRRVTHLMSGSWEITGPGSREPAVTIDSLKGLKAVGKLVLKSARTML